MDQKKLAVGWFDNAPFIESCSPYRTRIKEVFFAWPGVLSCRPAPDYTPELKARQLEDLKWARSNGIELDTLFNCNCYGESAISHELADMVVRVLKEMDSFGVFPDIVTTTSPFVATILRKNFKDVKIRWSVNLRVHGTVGLESVIELFDSFYVSREHHRSLDYLKEIDAWARIHGKSVGMQLNSGCLRQCPFQQFHDNLHGHNRISQSKVGENFDFSVFRCKTNYDRGNYEDFLRATWIAPQDVWLYEKYVDVMKIATRRHPDPREIIKAYATGNYSGDLARLMDPAHKFPGTIDSELLSSNELWNEVRSCKNANNCLHCGKCSELLKEVFR